MPRHDDPGSAPLSPLPWEALHQQLLAHAEGMVAAGDASRGAALRATVDAWWQEQQRWKDEAGSLLALHHEINNALVGVSGNVQILLMGPCGQDARVRERLETVLRESQRIGEASVRLRRLRVALGGSRSAEAGRVTGEAA